MGFLMVMANLPNLLRSEGGNARGQAALLAPSVTSALATFDGSKHTPVRARPLVGGCGLSDGIERRDGVRRQADVGNPGVFMQMRQRRGAKKQQKKQQPQKKTGLCDLPAGGTDLCRH